MAVHDSRRLRQVFTNLNPVDDRGNRVVVRSWYTFGGVALPLGVPRINMACTAAEPEHDAMVGLAYWGGGRRPR